MSMLDRKLLRELSRSKGLLLAITSIIAAGVACFVSMQSAFHNMDGAKEDYYRQCRMADFWVDVKKVPLPELQAVAQIPGVAEVQPRIQFYATADLPDVVEPINSQVISLPDLRERVINGVVMQQGSYFTDRRANEVIVNAAFAREHRLEPGDWIHLLLNNRRQELFVVGTAISSEFTYLLGPGAMIPDPEHFGVFYVKHSYAEDVFDFQGAANQLVGLFTPEYRQRADAVLQRIEDTLDPFGVFSTTELKFQTSNQFLSSEIEQLSMFATLMPAIFLTVAAMVLNVLMIRLTRQQRVVVGTLKALGCSDAQVFMHYLKFGLSVGLAGGLLGGALGYWLSIGYTVMYRQFYEFPRLDSEVYPYIYLIGLLVSVACAVAGSSYSIWSMLQLRPAEAMRPEPPRKGGRILLEHVGVLWRRLSSSWRTALRSVFRHRIRTAAGMFAAAMGSCILVTGFLSQEAISYLIDFQFYDIMRSDVDLTFETESGRHALDEVRRLPGVDYAEPVLNVACTFHNGPYERKAGITGLQPDARLTVPRDAQGRALEIPATGILMSRRLAELLHVSPGETIVMEPVKGERRPVEVPIVQIADSFLGMSVYADIDYLSQLVDEHFAMTGAQLELDGDPNNRRRLYRELKQLPAVESINSRDQLIERLVTLVLEMQWISISFLVGFAGVIFFGSIVNASLVNLAERQREVATLISLGYTQWQVGSVFLRESLVTNTLGTVLGMPLGYLLLWTVAIQFANDVMRFPVVLAPWVFFLTLALALVFVLIGHAFVQWQISRMDVVEALKVKE